ncbi:WD repeat-containing protein [Reticulomyxa filosa]|uniref:WD repeat-containing protein n=1 Tax=Reticulomyxa filosa TaxID=46433 RepID=X6LGK4_RETFI|nr:WD repeat-containing protein [Reticulomyxa filosa]|eukprot:ETO00719.1 WD repeat-containing protein [Reticulomyxa filosa]
MYSFFVYCVKFLSYSSSKYHLHNKQLQIFNRHANGVCGIKFSSFNDSRYLCSGSYDNIIRLWDVETSKPLHIFNRNGYGVLCVDISSLQSNGSCDNIINQFHVIKGDDGNGEIIFLKFSQLKKDEKKRKINEYIINLR